MEKITIKKIAELAGVSVSAVSFVLNNKKGVSEETRQRVLNIINELDYTPNVNSRRLILQRSFNLIVCLDDRVSTIDNFFYTEILSAIISKGEKLGYSIVLSKSSSEDIRARFEQNLSQSNADGIIFLQDISEKLQKSIEGYKIPYIVVDSHDTSSSYHCITSDAENASYTATKYLVDNGHRKIAFIGMNRVPSFYSNTFSGYKRALEETDITVQEDWIQPDAFDEESSTKCMMRILKSENCPTAVFCASDLLAIGAMKAATEAGYRIPEDISFIGMDDIVLSRYCSPTLTTMHIDKYKMGKMAVEILDQLINGKDAALKHHISYDKLIERNTVCKIVS